MRAMAIVRVQHSMKGLATLRERGAREEARSHTVAFLQGRIYYRSERAVAASKAVARERQDGTTSDPIHRRGGKRQAGRLICMVGFKPAQWRICK